MLSLDAYSRAQVRLAAGPAAELQRFPRPSSRNQGRGPTSNGKGGKGRRIERVGEGKERGEGGEGKGGCLRFV